MRNGEEQQQQRANSARCKNQPPTLVRGFRFSPQRRPDIPPEPCRSSIPWSASDDGLVQGTNPLLEPATLFTRAQVQFNFARVDDVQLAINVGMNALLDL